MAARLTRTARWALAPLHDRTTWAGGVVLVVGAFPALVVLAVVSAGLLVGAALAPVGLGVPVLVASLVVVRAAADVDRRLFGAALGVRAELDVDDAVTAGGWRERARSLLADPRTWRSSAWLAVRCGAGLLTVLGLLVTAVVAVALLAVPFVDGYLAFGSDWRSSSGRGSAWTLLAGAGLLVGVAHGLRLLTAAHLRLAETLLGPDPAERLAALERAVERSDTRERLARDLHDGLGHALTLVVVQAEAATTALDDRPDAARAHLAAVTEAARQALGDLDRALDLLHGGASRREPGIDDVPGLVRAARAAGLDVALTWPQESAPMHGRGAAAVAGAVYRVVQEALTNALRHSPSRSAAVSLDRGADGLRVMVRTPDADSGNARGSVRGRGRGLTGLRDRVAATGGSLDAGPVGGEFVVEAVWPQP